MGRQTWWLCGGDALSNAIRFCPSCLDSNSLKKNGHVRGRQRYRCRCGHQFTGGMVADVVLAASQARIREVAGLLIQLAVPIATIAAATDLSLSWLYQERRSLGTIALGQSKKGGAGE